jgi:hypothetical protein
VAIPLHIHNFKYYIMSITKCISSEVPKEANSYIQILSITKEIWADLIMSYLTLKDKYRGFRLTSKWFEKIIMLHFSRYVESIQVCSVEDFSFVRLALGLNTITNTTHLASNSTSSLTTTTTTTTTLSSLLLLSTSTSNIQPPTSTRTKRTLKQFTCYIDCKPTKYNDAIDNEIKIANRIFEETLQIVEMYAPTLVEFSLRILGADEHSQYDEHDHYRSLRFVDYLMNFFINVIISIKTMKTITNDTIVDSDIKSPTIIIESKEQFLTQQQQQQPRVSSLDEESIIPVSISSNVLNIPDKYVIQDMTDLHNKHYNLETIVIDTRLWTDYPNIIMNIPADFAPLFGSSLKKLELLGIHVFAKDIVGTVCLLKELKYLSISVLIQPRLSRDPLYTDLIRIILSHLPKLMTLLLSYSLPEPVSTNLSIASPTKMYDVKEKEGKLDGLDETLIESKTDYFEEIVPIYHYCIEYISSFIPITEQFFKKVQVCSLNKFEYRTWNNLPVSDSLIEQFFLSRNRVCDTSICEFHTI